MNAPSTRKRAAFPTAASGYRNSPGDLPGQAKKPLMKVTSRNESQNVTDFKHANRQTILPGRTLKTCRYMTLILRFQASRPIESVVCNVCKITGSSVLGHGFGCSIYIRQPPLPGAPTRAFQHLARNLKAFAACQGFGRNQSFHSGSSGFAASSGFLTFPPPEFLHGK